MASKIYGAASQRQKYDPVELLREAAGLLWDFAQEGDQHPERALRFLRLHNLTCSCALRRQINPDCVLHGKAQMRL